MYSSHYWHGSIGMVVVTLYQVLSFYFVVRWRWLDYSIDFLAQTMGDKFLRPRAVGFTTGWGNVKVYLARYIHPVMGYVTIAWYSRNLFTGGFLADNKWKIGPEGQKPQWQQNIIFALVIQYIFYAVFFGMRGMRRKKNADEVTEVLSAVTPVTDIDAVSPAEATYARPGGKTWYSGGTILPGRSAGSEVVEEGDDVESNGGVIRASTADGVSREEKGTSKKPAPKVEGAGKLIGSFAWHGVTVAFALYLVWVTVMHQ